MIPETNPLSDIENSCYICESWNGYKCLKRSANCIPTCVFDPF